MSMRQFSSTNRNAEAAWSSLENVRPPAYTTVATAPTGTHTDSDSVDSPNDRMGAQNVSLPGCDSKSVMLPDETPTDTRGVAETSDSRYSKRPSDKPIPLLICVNLLVYYRIYAVDGAIPSKIPAAPSGDPFLGRIKARSVAPPHTAQSVKRCIAKMENIKDRTSTTLFLTPSSQSPMGDADKVTIRNRTGPGSMPQEPLALVAKMSDSERSALEFGGKGELASAAEPGTTSSGIRYRTSVNTPTFLFITF